MTTYLKNFIYEGANGLKVSVSQTLEKYARAAFWRVDYCHVYKGVEHWYTYKTGLLNKPNKRQIQSYLETL